jgi:hypothetical protein
MIRPAGDIAAAATNGRSVRSADRNANTAPSELPATTTPRPSSYVHSNLSMKPSSGASIPVPRVSRPALPKPGWSTATAARPSCASSVSKGRQVSAESLKPWRSTTVGPAPGTSRQRVGTPSMIARLTIGPSTRGGCPLIQPARWDRRHAIAKCRDQFSSGLTTFRFPMRTYTSRLPSAWKRSAYRYRAVSDRASPGMA